MELERRNWPEILLLGGGYTLARLARRIAPGRALVTTRDSAKALEFLDQGIHAMMLDLARPSELRELLAKYPGIKTLVDSVPPRPGQPPEREMLDALGCSGIGRVIYLSTTGVFGGENGEWVDESSPPNPKHASAEARLAWEHAYRSLGKELCVLRLPAIYGPDRSVRSSLESGKLELVDGGERWSNRIHVEDLADTIEAILDRVRVPEVLCVSDDEPAKLREVVSYYMQRFDLPAPRAISLEEAKRQGRHTMTGSQRVRNALLKEILGRELKFPSYRAGADHEKLALFEKEIGRDDA